MHFLEKEIQAVIQFERKILVLQSIYWYFFFPLFYSSDFFKTYNN